MGRRVGEAAARLMVFGYGPREASMEVAVYAAVPDPGLPYRRAEVHFAVGDAVVVYESLSFISLNRGGNILAILP